jgi:hypothetical protein
MHSSFILRISRRFEVIAKDVAINMTTSRPGIRFNGLIDKLVQNWDTAFSKKVGVSFEDIANSDIPDDIKVYYDTLIYSNMQRFFNVFAMFDLII